MPSEGIFKGWITGKVFGFISTEGQKKDTFVVKSSVENPEDLVAGTPVSFNIIETDRGPQAENIQKSSSNEEFSDDIDTSDENDILEKTISGVVVSWNDKGYAFIKSAGESSNIFAHHTKILDSSKKTLSPKDVVEYNKIVNPTDGRVSASNIKVVGFEKSGNDFDDGFDMGGSDWLVGLEDLAEDEDWTFSQKDSNQKFPVLRSYIKYTALRIIETGKDRYSSDGNFRAINTGLVTDNQQEIFMVFAKNKNENGRPWVYKNIHRDSERQFLEKFGANIPPLAEYFDNPADLLFDRRKNLTIDTEHVLRRLDRFPEKFRDDPYGARIALEAAERNTRKRVHRNYKAAIPQFFRGEGKSGELQLLLPLCMEKANVADVALTVSHISDNKAYLASTVLTLDMAYNNARLLARPDSDWLRVYDEED